ncbi:unnamed protein product [Adineta steineri]|uniref:Selenoprotein F n=1 Tax=Adineta steineri TaxID=433720 RepID=A0A814C7Y9_9BILA|nr:unnamed protein product [Adineta steineri]CAF0971817.1 unnamed protein product [Adineta steineri]
MCNTKFLAIFCSLLSITFVTSDLLSSIDCLNRGFSSDNLLCSNCHDLKQFKLNELENTCQQCCTHTDNGDDDEKGIKYSRAVLTVCTCKFGRYPQIEAFIKSNRPKQFPTFSFKHVPGAEPVLHLYNDKDENVQSLGIEKWDTDTLTAFLEENLQV